MVHITSVHDYWKNHSFDYMNPQTWKSNTIKGETVVMWTWTSKGVHSTPRGNWTLWQSLQGYLGDQGRCVGFSLRGLLLLQSMGSRHMGFSICSTQAQESWHTGLVAPQHVESSQTRDWTRDPSTGRQTPVHWTTGKSVLSYFWRQCFPDHS